jgi:alpha-tubulin suppressor-like RCC1 family protein
VGLKADGTVVAVGENYGGQCNVDGWIDIIQIAAGYDHTVGLKEDGTVVDTTFNAGSWTNIVQVSAGYAQTVGVKDDGTVVAVGDNEYGQCDFGAWMLIS